MCCMFVVSDRLSLRSVICANDIMGKGVCQAQDTHTQGRQEMGRDSSLIFDHMMLEQTSDACATVHSPPLLFCFPDGVTSSHHLIRYLKKSHNY